MPPGAAEVAARLATGFWVGALRRRVEAAGGFAMVLAKGDPEAGSVLLLLRAEDGSISAISKVNVGDGKTTWQTIFDKRSERDEAVREALEKRRRFDPDLWIIELDIDDPARFIDGDILDH